MKTRLTSFHTKPRKPLVAKKGFRVKRAVVDSKAGQNSDDVNIVYPPKRKALPHSRKKAKRSKLPSSKTMRNKCDKLLTPIIKLMYPTCLFTGEPTEVAHHHFKKSTSSACRYYIPNLIPLTHKAHMRLHSDEILWAGRVVQNKGLEWLEDLERQKKVEVKTDVHWYMENYKRLRELYDSLL